MIVQSSQGKKSEMIKVPNPRTKSCGREAYYTNIKFEFNAEKVTKTVKVDTGATYTVIGLADDYLIQYKDKILHSGMPGTA